MIELATHPSNPLVHSGGPVVIECETCRHVGVDSRSGFISLVGAGVIGTGILAVHKRDGRLLYMCGPPSQPPAAHGHQPSAHM